VCGLLARFPRAALGAVVIFAALRLIDVAGFRRITRFRRSEAVIAVATAVAVLGVGVLYGVLVAVGLSVLDLLHRLARPHDGVLGYVPGVAGMHDIDDYPDARPVPGLLVYRYDAPLCFANAGDFRRRALAARWTLRRPPRWFLLNAEANVEIDSTAAEGLAALHGELARRGVVLALARFKHELHADLRTAGLLDVVGDDRVFMTLPIAVQAFHRSCGHSGETGQGCHTEPAGSDLGATSGPSTPTSRVRRTCSGPSSRRTLDP
jgi:sulfate permease, SulP family